jgi:hypothetical protein
MLISADILIPFPSALVFSTYRDKLEELVPYLQNVKQVELKLRRQEGDLTHLVNEWQGGGDIPAIVRPLLADSIFSWTEFITWNQSQLTADWSIKSHIFSEAVECFGRNQFIDQENATLVQSRGNIKIDPQRIKGTPLFIAHGLAKVVEEFLAQKIEPNLREMGRGVSIYLSKQD